ncbi:subtilisin-like protein [Coniophora puteana RWD-64-598 SS2]|uniref:tripeptidyl-peptidase II n=1 Tax=Coniophora puteana (strain RWD-64-598) TaxID=741705 RepID=A0A5M3MPL5_CONPW|nr:subtilisin-like protein [Coniophora puteana RWD-64-598 SS2]EIW80511.1 subtilisin-like protein [Coniophora puteana RWD-64-598 SS2]
MRGPLLRLVLLGLALVSSAEPLLSPHVVHERRRSVPAGWTRTRRHASDAVLPLRFALAQQNIGSIDEYLLDVAHPESPNYGKHWTAGDVARKFAASEESIVTVLDWLEQGGIERGRARVSTTRGWVHVDATVEEAERLVNAEYHVYTHDTGKEHIACEAYHLPEHVTSHVDFVLPSVHFDAKLSRRSDTSESQPPLSTADQPAHNIGLPGVGISPKSGGKVTETVSEVEQCDEYITPICLRTLYGLDYTPVATDKNSYGIVEYTPQAYLWTDLQMFALNYSLDTLGKAPYMVSIDGGYPQTVNQSFDYNGESDLDLQYGMTLVTGAQTVTLYQTGDIIEGASFNNFLDALDGSYCTFEGGDDYTQDSIFPDPYPGGYKGPEDCGTVKPANVISTSYGYNEADLTPFYAERQCAEYAKLGLMGVTVLYSSGDDGVAGNGDLCLNPDGTQTANGTIFDPSFPGVCPYITSVGATQVKNNTSVYSPQPEMACMEVIYSGGGFSNYFPIPSYQEEAVSYYLENYPPDYPPTIWNATGKSRAFPDIAANGANYVVAIDGEFELVYGTSCSSPVSGAIFTMINDARLAAGKSTIGFINPTIYSSKFAGAFNDITEGTNPGCNTEGFNATPGWDPVTGLGTPNFPKLLAAWLELP